MHSRKKITYITLNGQIPSTSANSVGVMTMCGQYAAQGLDVELLIPGAQDRPLQELGNSEDVFEYYAVAAPFEIKRFPNPLRGRLSKIATGYTFLMVLCARAKNVDLIVTRTLEAAVWAARMNIPVLLESHNFEKFARRRAIKRWVALTQDRTRSVSMLTTTRAGKDSYAALGVPEGRIRVLANGVNIERFRTATASVDELRQQLRLDENKPVLAFCGSLKEGRGGEELIDCAALLPETQMVIVGGASTDVRRYRDKAAARGLTNISFPGHVDQAQLPRYLHVADILLMPYTTRFAEHSLRYTSPMKMFEYLATGKPIIATDFPVFHEILEHGRNAFFVKPDSGSELAKGVRALLEDEVLRQRLAANAEEDAKQYSWKARAAQVIEWQIQLGHLQ